MKSLVLASLVGAVALSGCSMTGTLNASSQADVQTALNIGCPIVGTIVSSGLKLNKYQTAAVATLQLACPPNPPPTSAVVAVSDLIAAYSELQPLLVK